MFVCGGGVRDGKSRRPVGDRKIGTNTPRRSGGGCARTRGRVDGQAGKRYRTANVYAGRADGSRTGTIGGD